MSICAGQVVNVSPLDVPCVLERQGKKVLCIYVKKLGNPTFSSKQVITMQFVTCVYMLKSWVTLNSKRVITTMQFVSHEQCTAVNKHEKVLLLEEDLLAGEQITAIQKGHL